MARRGHIRDEPVAPLRNRLDVLWGALAVTERAPQVGNRPGQGRLRDEPAPPHGVDDLVPRDHVTSTAGQKGQEIHHLRLEMPEGLAVADVITSGSREPAAHAKVWGGGRTNLPAGHGPILRRIPRARAAASAVLTESLPHRYCPLTTRGKVCGTGRGHADRRRSPGPAEADQGRRELLSAVPGGNGRSCATCHRPLRIRA